MANQITPRKRSTAARTNAFHFCVHRKERLSMMSTIAAEKISAFYGA